MVLKVSQDQGWTRLRSSPPLRCVHAGHTDGGRRLWTETAAPIGGPRATVSTATGAASNTHRTSKVAAGNLTDPDCDRDPARTKTLRHWQLNVEEEGSGVRGQRSWGPDSTSERRRWIHVTVKVVVWGHEPKPRLCVLAPAWTASKWSLFFSFLF